MFRERQPEQALNSRDVGGFLLRRLRARDQGFGQGRQADARDVDPGARRLEAVHRPARIRAALLLAHRRQADADAAAERTTASSSCRCLRRRLSFSFTPRGDGTDNADRSSASARPSTTATRASQSLDSSSPSGSPRLEATISEIGSAPRTGTILSGDARSDH